jgi:hypothetical protein
MKKNKTFAKIAEIIFSTGIPLVAFFSAEPQKNIKSFAFLIFAIFAAGWHIKTLNDIFEQKRPLTPNLARPGIIFPLLLLTIPIIFCPNMILPLLLIILNWNIYSIFGKNYFLFSMANNFLGGFLHYELGLSAASLSINKIHYSPEALFFGFAMLCGSMHHDAYHAEEDRNYGFNTGAVKFGADKWWKLAVFPMLISIFFLAKSDKSFFFSFIYTGIIPYFIAYFAILSFCRAPSKKYFFRYFCRAIFAVSAILYFLPKIG